MKSFKDAFFSSPYQGVKHTSYFETYDILFNSYQNKEIVFVEVGIQGGGSLFAWKEYFGPKARIIGIDLNPAAKVLREQGFEVFIGDQANEDFWVEFFSVVGTVDIILDDGGHTYEQQIRTVEACLPNVKDGGLVVVEDTHTSYMDGFGPKSRSIVKYAKLKIDQINRRDETVLNLSRGKKVETNMRSIRIFESIIAFEVDNASSASLSTVISNDKPAVSTEDFRNNKDHILSFLEKIQLKYSRQVSNLPRPVAVILLLLFRFLRKLPFFEVIDCPFQSTPRI